MKYPEDEDEYNSCEYEGFDMSGYWDANYKNLAVLSRFGDLLQNKERDGFIILPLFWKGSCTLVRINCAPRSHGDMEVLEDLGGGYGSDDIVMKIIKHTSR